MGLIHRKPGELFISWIIESLSIVHMTGQALTHTRNSHIYCWHPPFLGELFFYQIKQGKLLRRRNVFYLGEPSPHTTISPARNELGRYTQPVGSFQDPKEETEDMAASAEGNLFVVCTNSV